MVHEELKLNDIADELLILNKYTIDKLFTLENCADCIALYVFYYKTAKWQKTNTIKANDTYIKKSLKWGAKKILQTKKTLKESGLIDIVQRRKDNKIEGWYIKVSYLVQQKTIEDIKINVETVDITDSSNNSQKQQVAKATSSFEDINALKDKIKCLNKEIEMLKEKEINKEINKVDCDSSALNDTNLLKTEFEEIWSKYPRKVGKDKAFKTYCKYRKSHKDDYVTKDEVLSGLEKYLRHIEVNNIDTKYIKHGSTWFNSRGWEDVYQEPTYEHIVYDGSNNPVFDSSIFDSIMNKGKGIQC